MALIAPNRRDERTMAANIEAEKAGRLAPACRVPYTEDATYGWNYGPKKDPMVVGRDEIRDIALGQGMAL